MPTWSTGAASAPANEVANYGTGVVGFSPFVRTTGRQHKLGQTTRAAGNYLWIYIKASAALAAGATYASPTVITVDTATGLGTAGAGAYTAYAPFAINEYGWVRKTAVDV